MKQKNEALKKFLSQKPKFEKVSPFLKRPVEISERFAVDSQLLYENIVIINLKKTKS